MINMICVDKNCSIGKREDVVKNVYNNSGHSGHKIEDVYQLFLKQKELIASKNTALVSFLSNVYNL